MTKLLYDKYEKEGDSFEPIHETLAGKAYYEAGGRESWRLHYDCFQGFTQSRPG